MQALRSPHFTFRNWLSSYRYALTLFTIFATITGAAGFSRDIQAEAGPQISQSGGEVARLAPGKPVEGELAAGQSHSYRVELAADQYLLLVCHSSEIALVVTILEPGNREVLQIHSPQFASTPVSLIAKVGGNYRLEVRADGEQAKVGRYQVQVAEIRAAVATDHNRIAAQAAFAQADQLRAQGQAEAFQQAIRTYGEARRYAQAAGDAQGEARALEAIGAVYLILSEYQRALDSYTQALRFRQNLADRRGEAIALNQIGYACLNLGQYPTARQHFEKALELGRVVGDRRVEARALHNLGEAAYYVNDAGALELFQQALALWRAEKDRQGEAGTLTWIGHVYANSGEMQKALTYHSQALPHWRAARDIRGEIETLRTMGMDYSGMGESQKALDLEHQSLELARSAGDRYGEVCALSVIGIQYQALGENREALSYFEQALQLFRQINNPHIEATSLFHAGRTYNLLGEKQKALGAFERMLALGRTLKDKQLEAMALHGLGDTRYLLQDKSKALDYHLQALALSRAIQFRRLEADALDSIGNLYEAMAEHQKALNSHHQALALRRAIDDHSGAVESLYHLARAKRHLGDLAGALADIREATEKIESLRVKVASSDLRASYIATGRQKYELYIDLLMLAHRQRPSEKLAADALHVSERARARSLLDLLAEARADIRQGVEPALLAQEKALKQQINAKEQARVRLLSGRHTPQQAEEANKELKDLLAQYEELRTQLRARSPRYAALTQPQPLTLPQVQQLLDPDTLLLEYVLGDDRSYLWAVSDTEVTAYELPGRAEIRAAAKKVYDALAGQSETVRAPAADAQYWQEAARLSRMILGPVAGQLGTKRLVIVADGALEYIPFAALPAPQEAGSRKQEAGGSRPSTFNLQPATNPLIANHEIISLPSASALAVLRQEIAERQPAPRAVAIFADPVFTKNDPRVQQTSVGRKAPVVPKSLPDDLRRSLRGTRVTQDGQVIERLPWTRREAAAIKEFAANKMYSFGDVLEATGFQANRAAAMSAELSRYRIVHFATHGLIHSDDPALSGIVLSLVNEQGEAQNGFLRLHDIYNLNLAAELVVLSACDTALGKQVRGEGLVGLVRGFMYAGAARVLASLWKVDDVATAELMKRFYRGMLAEGKRPAAALRAAQLEMAQQKRWQSPYYWAAFSLQGEWR
ncbi:MAG TPA: CHAT domain-containing tetratricopeptide repeat protein [Blastocatellia bacterium]|nr:CHAT domain-containing tetratricopeptide repeat protein [Blastocatellia bacterium]